MQEFWYDFITAVLTTIAVVGSFANLAVIIVVARNSKLWNRQCMLIFNVACADFIMATFGIVMPLVSSVYRRWFFGDLGCDIYAFTMNIVGIASVTTLAFLALDRALKVRQSQFSLRMPSTGLIIISIWIYSFTVTSPPLFGWGEFVPEGPGVSCSVDWQSVTWNSLSYTVFLFVTGFFAQLLVMILSYRSIYLVIRQVTRQGRQRFSAVDRAERRVGRMLLIMLLCFLIAWIPYVIVALAKVFSAFLGKSSILVELNDIYGYIPALLAKSSITYNPIIYAVFNTQFRPTRAICSPNRVNVGDSRKTGDVSTHQITIPPPDLSNDVL